NPRLKSTAHETSVNEGVRARGKNGQLFYYRIDTQLMNYSGYLYLNLKYKHRLPKGTFNYWLAALTSN
ncbi:hypothetical protein, partial [Klebsiella michiganensis]|uniref:hypothetical protein n=1 Tax=Klebsiella michiganensis TaxID=1134687 RepID=UPI001CCDB30C